MQSTTISLVPATSKLGIEYSLYVRRSITRLKPITYGYIRSLNNEIETNKNMIRNKIRIKTDKAIPSTRMGAPSIKEVVPGTA